MLAAVVDVAILIALAAGAFADRYKDRSRPA
jgi:hypothetical protein